jgi:hypothetical protein
MPILGQCVQISCRSRDSEATSDYQRSQPLSAKRDLLIEACARVLIHDGAFLPFVVTQSSSALISGGKVLASLGNCAVRVSVAAASLTVPSSFCKDLHGVDTP